MSPSPNRHTRIARTTTVAAATLLAGVGTVATASGAGATAELTGSPASATSLEVVGITPNGRLITFTADDTDKPELIGMVSGLEADTRVIGMDFRVQNGELYAVGDLGGVYTVDLGDAEATKVSQLTVLPEGRQFGVDFNPAADRLRIVSDTGQNLRHDVNTGGTTTMDGVLSYTPPTPATGITMAAYTNNDLSAQTGTSLFDIDTNLNQVALQSPANNGSLAATGALGVDAAAAGGFDIYSELDDDGVTTSLVGLASIKPVGQPRTTYRVNLLSGHLTELATQWARFPVVDIAIPLDQR